MRNGHDALDRGAVRAIRQFLTDPAATHAAVWSSTRTRTSSSPAGGYWLSGPTNQPGHDTQPSASRPGALTPVPPIRYSRCPTPARSRHQREPPDHTSIPEPTVGAR